MKVRTSFVVAVLLTTPLLAAVTAADAFVDVGVSINVAPPELPVYEQPPIPAPGYLWTPGYWAWDGDDYYWVPGTWVLAPQPGFLWTPGYWEWADGAYLWHAGYWGPHVGFYGGVDYGFGYTGVGYAGGEWRGGAFYYNRAVCNIPENVHITNVYNRTVINNVTINRVTVNRVSFNGGTGGTAARPTSQELSAEHEHHLAPVSAQVHHEQVARAEPALHAKTNHGVPAIAATSHAASFHGDGVVGARGAVAMNSHPAPRNEPSGAATTVAQPPHAAPPPAHNAPQPQVHTFRPEPHNSGAPAAAPHPTPPPAPEHGTALPPHGEPPHGEPPHVEPPHGEPPHGEPPHAAAPSHGEPQRGEPPHTASRPERPAPGHDEHDRRG